MGLSARISSCHLSLSVSPTVRMVFLPRLPLLLFIAFLGYCSSTIVKADGTMKSCKSVFVPTWKYCKAQAKIPQGIHGRDIFSIDGDCHHEGNRECHIHCYDSWKYRECICNMVCGGRVTYNLNWRDGWEQLLE